MCVSPTTPQEVVALNKPLKVLPSSAHGTGMSPYLTQVTPVSSLGSQEMPIQAPIFIVCTGQQPQPGKHGMNITNGHFPQNGTTTLVQAPGTGQPLPILNGTGLPTQTQLIFSPQVSHQTNGFTPNAHHKLDIHPIVHHPTMINGQTVVQAPPILLNLNGAAASLIQPNRATASLIQPNGAAASLIQPNGQPAMIMPSQQMIGGEGNIYYTTTNVLPPPPLQSTPEIVTPTTSSIRTTPAVPLSAQKRQAIVRQNHTPICISPSSISENKKGPPPLMRVKQEVNVVGDSEVLVHDSRHLTSCTVTSPTPENLQLSQQMHCLSSQPSPKVTVLPHSHAAEVNHSPLSTSPPAMSVLKKSQGVCTSLPYIVLNEKQQRDTGRQIVFQPSQDSKSGGSNIAQLYGGNCLPIYRFNSTLNNIQPLQIVTSLPNFIKRDTHTAH